MKNKTKIETTPTSKKKKQKKNKKKQNKKKNKTNKNLLIAIRKQQKIKTALTTNNQWKTKQK
jgi:hypothetical protein